jgi:putative ABC transport system ATP-binding protein
VIELSGLAVRYGAVTAVQPVSFALPAGLLVAVTGPAGAGKTSLLTAMAGVVGHEGDVLVDGTPVRGHADAVRAGMVLVPQGNGLARILSATENIALPVAALAGASRPDLPSGDPRDAALDVLDRVGLAESGNHLVEELSGGQQQRVAVARGLALRGTVLLADESTSELDSANRALVLRLLRAEADRGAVVLFASNDLEAAEACDAHGTLDEGRFAWLRPPAG